MRSSIRNFQLRLISALTLCAALAACGGPAEPVWAPDAELRKFSYRHAATPEIRLYTVISKRSGSGAHSGLLIAGGGERILFDPAGSFGLPFAPERNDVHFAITDRALAVYIDYHARETYDVIEQRVPVSAAQAAAIAKLAKEYGAVPKAQCTLSITRILSKVPGFESIGVGYFPLAAMKDVEALPGVETRKITDDDADKNHNVLIRASGLGG